MSQPLIGKPLDRVEGPAKVTGEAVYTGDVPAAGLLHAVVVESTIANGRILSIDETRARAAAGVVEIMTHRNAPRVNAAKTSPNDSILSLLQDDRIDFDRQPVVVVLAETFEEATYAAQLVRVHYDAEAPQLDLATAPRFVPKEIFGRPAKHRRGNPQRALSNAPVRIEQIYRTPTEHHNPMETHGTLAEWNGDRLTLHDSSQWAFGVQRRMAKIFGIEPTQVRVIVPFVGGAFGSKGQPWSHVALAAMAAKLTDRPVKLIVARPQMFGWVGHRPQTEQRIALGADHSGRLLCVTHDVLSETSVADEFVEACGVFSRDLYVADAYGMSHALPRLNISKPTYQRGPGESTGSFAMESAMDELSYELGIDPLELRLRNYATHDPDQGKPYSSKRLRECYAKASEAFDWRRRTPAPRSMSNGRMLVGLGMATASRATHRTGAKARIRLNADGSVVVECGTIEQGCGSPTVYAQLAAEILDLPFERVRFAFGDTNLPEAPLAAGSQTSGSVGSVVVKAANALAEKRAALRGTIPNGGIVLDVAEEPDEDDEPYATQAFGAQFAQVEVDPDLGEVRVVRFVGAFDGGRILNAKTANSQFVGGIVWGIGMALFEKTRYDARTARIMNANLSDYLVPTNADIPNPEVITIEADDEHINPAHVKGIGEVGITGVAAAVANAVYHATGVRVRELPITPDRLLS
ncbi:MAG TPA: xanthine dehydrogenase family protein molybdopterin-binding subunit [Candidatus Cybelea sp.]|jgi:xanthine dehydrogenase YagR molybdenum-binding subunit|nr:xanthine dehydrogenase family protein molybdopterin-binding subunit [Candidatus Cybelea sp.]